MRLGRRQNVYINSYQKKMTGGAISSESVQGSPPEKVVENCGFTRDVAPGGQYVLSLIATGNKVGIYGYSRPIRPARRWCRECLPSACSLPATENPFCSPHATMSPSIARVARPEKWSATAVYARPGGDADLYLVSQR
jgi:hypothetical protein